MSRTGKLVNSGFTKDDDAKTISVTYDDNGVLNLKFGKGSKRVPYSSRVYKDSGAIVYSAYSSASVGTEDRKTLNLVLKALKGIGEYKMSPEDIDHFITRTAIYASSVLKNLKIDYILPVNSSSEMNKEFASKIAERLSGAEIVHGMINKGDVGNIVVDTANPRMTPELEKSVQKMIESATVNGVFYMKKVKAQYRQYIKNFMELDQSIQSKIADKNVLIVDDYLTTGATLGDAIKQTYLYAPGNVYGMVLLK